jgi:predicted lipoprotein
MKNLFKNSVYAAAALVLALGAASCSDSDGDYTFADEREEALKDAAVDFVDNNVIPTYKALADGSIALQEDCEAMLEAFDAGTLTTPLVQAACNDWITTRKHWELSEAYLYGAAADYDIDPHIDSWPLDGTALQNLLHQKLLMQRILFLNMVQLK